MVRIVILNKYGSDWLNNGQYGTHERRKGFKLQLCLLAFSTDICTEGNLCSKIDSHFSFESDLEKQHLETKI